MDFDKLVQVRQSCRSFDVSRPVEKEKIEACVRAAKCAPSAMNDQPYDIWVVVDNVEAAAEARLPFNECMGQCPVIVVFTDAAYRNTNLIDISKETGTDYRSLDIGESIAYFTLQAADLGLSTCILGGCDIAKMHRVLGTDAHIEVVVALGYASEGYPVRPKRRKPVSENVHFL